MLTEERLGAYNRQQIVELLPYGAQWVLPDRVEDVKDHKGYHGRTILAYMEVRGDALWVPLHFLLQAVFPGVLMEEFVGHAVGVALAPAMKEKKLFPMYSSADQVKHRKPVLPGDKVIAEIRVLRLRSSHVRVSYEATVGDQVVSEGELGYTLVAAEMIMQLLEERKERIRCLAERALAAT